ncbi:endo alpha-1,4 polygalactosaminidase [Leifsonia sp. NCR5]|uniref:endo alpha-1,4 polygalactosaminidase n=1 Tax=Leifsonia sp. NCR5 TaxID=1978342 RepID=UPI000A1944A0|nr:endo alpha-1,4 polygalactosaminidase [Leifsonia sp. NCR5]
MTFRTVPAFLLAAAALVLTGCAASGEGEAATSAHPAPAHPAVALPAAGARFDYQLGGAYTPPEGVTVVERDRTSEPSGAGYDICYVNGFQTQPDASKAFAAEHPELVVQTPDGPLVDEGWPDEYIFDTSTEDKRGSLAAIVGTWIRGCADSGFSAVEIDNLDSYTRSDGALSVKDNLALAADYARIAHDAGLAIAQKNTADQSAELKAAGYDFAVTESCFQFSECESYTDVYPVVLDIEYTDELGEDAFGRACSSSERPQTMILRDHSLVTPADDGYVYRSC